MRFITLLLLFFVGLNESPAQNRAFELNDELFANENKLNDFLDAKPCEVGFYAKNLKTGKIISRNENREVCLASTVKVFCLTELFRQIHADGLDITQKIRVSGHGKISLKKTADLMIGTSDNSATDALAEFLGRKKVNAIPSLLKIKTMSDDILPIDKTLTDTLDVRIYGAKIAKKNLPMHGTAKGLAKYYELLSQGNVISKEVSNDLIEFFKKHPKPFSKEYRKDFVMYGKGGNILWTRPPKHYSMMGWGLILEHKKTKEQIVVCVWGEWFPESVVPSDQAEFLEFVGDSVVNILTKN